MSMHCLRVRIFLRIKKAMYFIFITLVLTSTAAVLFHKSYLPAQFTKIPLLNFIVPSSNDTYNSTRNTNIELNSSFSQHWFESPLPRNVSDSLLDTLHKLTETMHREIGEIQVGLPDRPNFQRINNFDAWVYSAFYDTVNTTHTMIRVLGIQALDINDTVFCYLLENETVYMTVGNRTVYYDGYYFRHRITSYECEITNSFLPTEVSLTFNDSDTPTNIVKVFYSNEIQRNFSVCHSVLFNYNNHKQLIQSVEFNRILGAEHIFVYRVSVSKETDDVLRYYQKQRFLTVIQWSLPPTPLHYHGQILAINDCVYRNKGVSRFVAIQDTDEFIIPNHHDNWYDLITQIDKDFYAIENNSNTLIGSYIFESTFFQDRPNSSEWESIKLNNSLSSEEEQLMEKYSLMTLTHVKRLKRNFGRDRQKSIVKPEMVLVPEIHFTYEYRDSAIGLEVSVNMSLVHHHRKWDNSKDCFVETTSWKFKDKLIPLVNKTFNELFT